jgi:hypothetical protein
MKRHESEIRYGRRLQRLRNGESVVVSGARGDARESAREYVTRDARADNRVAALVERPASEDEGE